MVKFIVEWDETMWNTGKFVLTTEQMNIVCYSWIATALMVFVTMYFVTAPYGRHTSTKWGPSVNNKAAWFIKELNTFFVMLYYMVVGSKTFKSYVWILFAFWVIHYFYRTFIYVPMCRSTEKKMPFVIVLMSIFFNQVNAYINGFYLSEMADPADFGKEWLQSKLFLTGLAVFLTGAFINFKTDLTLIHLRKVGETGYKIPHGFLFELVVSPNFLGEIIEWFGFYLMARRNVAALCFAVWTFANLTPRAKNHSDWYKINFKNFPKRKIIIPFIY
ncbi:3-oxo-5-alpha-steroid_4-dehydrogenase [Hexamita inflata]|uniref:3-oxo-5-alpha-steroid 4-dehydrogenase n=1 Tax=Hexamita inflata TaxID=28002 RepID=A0AA86TM30_9EUKA|nr:3-oxo-5-alpha-steroid 4-dehydrogenase [Hexamita inflata]